MNFPDQILAALLEVLVIHDHPRRSLEDTQHGRVYDLASEEEYRSRARLSCFSAGCIVLSMLSVRIFRYAIRWPTGQNRTIP